MGSANAAAIINFRIMISLEFILRRNRLFFKTVGIFDPVPFRAVSWAGVWSNASRAASPVFAPAA
jgi:hypothetical protein